MNRHWFRFIIFSLELSKLPLIFIDRPLTMDAPVIRLSQEEIKLFHSIDRRLYEVLALELCLDPLQALNVITFWICLERLGFRNTVGNILSLSVAIISQLAQEAVTCLNYVNATSQLQSTFPPLNLPISKLVINQRLCLEFLVERRAEIVRHLTEVTNQVAHRALMDIFHEARERNAAWLRAEMDMVIASLPDPALLIGGDDERRPRRPVHPDHRTLFVTFSRGYPIAEQEIRDFFAAYYGDCIESLYMQEVGPGEQPLYARIVLYSVSSIEDVLSKKEKVKHIINGKHVWMRKFVPKKKQASTRE